MTPFTSSNIDPELLVRGVEWFPEIRIKGISICDIFAISFRAKLIALLDGLEVSKRSPECKTISGGFFLI